MNPWLEAGAVVLGLSYLLLAIRERRSCWVAGGIASLLFLAVFWQASLPMQAALQLYYALVAVHGWIHWGRDRSGSAAAIERRGRSYHLGMLGLWAALSLATLAIREYGASAGTDALGLQRVLDVLCSWGGVLATWMVARKQLEAWLYWIVIDSATVVLYLGAGLLASSALYALYTVLAVLGWREWRASFRKQNSD